MAKKRTGVFGAMGNLFRWTTYGLAAILLLAIYLGWSGQESEEAATVPVATPEPSVEQATEEAIAASDTVPSDSDEASKAEEAVDASLESSGEPGAAPAATELTETEEALPKDDATAITSFTVPGDDATYALQNAFQRDDGNIEFTTERTSADGATQSVTRLISCAPLAAGIISQDDGPRVDQPDMERLVLGSTEASVAAKACGVFR